MPPGTAVAIPGQAQASDNGCFVWRADNGWVFTLFQSVDLPNAQFDAVTAPGARSRLVLTVRGDLGDPCVEGAIVADVSQVLQVNGEDVKPAGDGGAFQ